MVIKKAKLIATHYYISVTIISKPDNNNLVTGRDRDTVSFLLVWTHFVHTAYIDQFVYCKDDQKWGESSLNWVLEHCSTSSIELNCQPWVFPSYWVHIHQLCWKTSTGFSCDLHSVRPVFSVHPLTTLWLPAARGTNGSCLRPSPRRMEWVSLCWWPLQWASSHREHSR